MEAFEPARKLIEAVNLAGGRFLGKTLIECRPENMKLLTCLTDCSVLSRHICTYDVLVM